MFFLWGGGGGGGHGQIQKLRFGEGGSGVVIVGLFIFFEGQIIFKFFKVGIFISNPHPRK